MDTEAYLKGQFQKCRRRMNLAKILDRGMGYAAAGGLLGALCELASLFWPFYYVHLAAGLCFGAGFLAGTIHALFHRADLKQAARRLDSFGLQERMVTACELLGQENEFARMQRQDAFLYYERKKEQIRIPLCPGKRHIVALFLSIILVAGLGLLPSPVRDQARIHHQVRAEARDEGKRLEELIEAMEAVDQESLTEEQQARLQELWEALELSREELTKAASWESLASARERLNYKYAQTAQGLEELAGRMGDPSDAGIADASALAKAIAGEKGIQTALSKTTGSSGGEKRNGDSGNESGQGQDGDNDGDGGNGSGGQGDGSAGGQSGENGQGKENEQESGGSNGQGGGSGQGGSGGQTGDGQGGGNGQGQGDGSGSGTGSGRGTGSSTTPHDYVSVPNASADDPALSGQKTGDPDSDYVRRQNGLAWEGNHVDHNAVIGEYTQQAYEGLTNGRFPSGMESVIRDYFESLSK